MISPRATILRFEKFDGKDRAELSVRAGSKAGASVVARLGSAHLIPLRDQEVVSATAQDTDRFLNVWKVTVQNKDVIMPSVNR